MSFFTQPTFLFFFFNDPATTEIYTLSLHDALPIWRRRAPRAGPRRADQTRPHGQRAEAGDRRQSGPLFARTVPWMRFEKDRESTRLNSSHVSISYAVFCLKKKKKKKNNTL